jgi:hypothetical protein
MAQYLNPSFEAGGATPGSATAWAVASLATAEETLGFSADEKAIEDFEDGWMNDSYVFAFSDDALIPLDFAPDPELGPSMESFEHTWLVEGNPALDTYLFHLSSTGALLFQGNDETEQFVGRAVASGTTNVAGTLLTSVAAAFTNTDIGRYVLTNGEPVAQITARSGDTVTITPAWSGDSLFAFDVSEWDHRLPPF